MKWQKAGGDIIISGHDGFLVSDGIFQDGSQTTVLIVSSEETTNDNTYTCLVTVNEHRKIAHPTSVSLNVFGKCFF